MFNRLNEVTANVDYQERIRQTALENYIARVERANLPHSSIRIRLGEILVQLGFRLQDRPRQSVKGLAVPR